MASFTVAMCTSFKAEILSGQHDLLTDTIKLALYTPSATIGEATTAYTTSNEVSGSGYTAGGMIMTSPVIFIDGTTAGGSFASPTFPAMTVPAIQVGLLYNASVSNKAIAVIAFGSPESCTNQSLEVIFGVNNSITGLLRILGA